ncbi:MAG: hypothetical protein AB7E60_02940 [Sphingobium sp.]
MTDAPNQNKDRQTVAAWLRVNGWTPDVLSRAMRAHPEVSNVPADTTLRLWLARRTAMKPCPLRDLMIFIARYPDPGEVHAFIDGVRSQFREQVASRDQDLLARRLSVERQREKWRREHLAREWAPRVNDRGPLAGLDKATVQALRGY